jgi:hypothetical protein
MEASPNTDLESTKRTSCNHVLLLLLLQVTRLSPLHGPDFVNCPESGNPQSATRSPLKLWRSSGGAQPQYQPR